MAPTIEHHGGHSRTPANQRWDQVPGRSQRLLLGEPHPPWMPATTTKVYIWRLDTGCGPKLYRKCHSHNTPGKRHNNTWVDWYKLDLKLVNTSIPKISYISNNMFQLYLWTQLFFSSMSWFMGKIITVLGYKIFITELSYAPDCWKCTYCKNQVKKCPSYN